MEKKSQNHQNEIETLPLDKVFSKNVWIDLDQRIVYDMIQGCAIGHVSILHDTVLINIQALELRDNNFQDLKQDAADYLNSDYVIVFNNHIYYRVNNGYLRIGELPSYRSKADIALPRIVSADDFEKWNGQNDEQNETEEES